MGTVTINAPKTPVTEGSNGIAAATIPNVCKMPGPPAPFIPTPLPNIGKSGNSPSGYSQDVTIDGNKVAIKGATFKSMGDTASQGTGGGLISNNVEGPTSFVGPGSMDVKIEGKNVQLLSDPMLNNGGPSGSPANSATMMGVVQGPGGPVTVLTGEEICLLCKKAHGAATKLAENDETSSKAAKFVTFVKAKVSSLNAAEPDLPSIQFRTMLGVVQCEHPIFYAEQSGTTYREVVDVAKKLGFLTAAESERPSVEALRVPVARQGRTQAESRRIRDRICDSVMERMGLSKAARRAFREEWNVTDTFQKAAANDARWPTCFPPGSCAAQKAILVAFDHKAFPTAVSEKYYNSEGDYSAAITCLHAPSGQVQKQVFKTGETVPPCATCEIILPMMLCPDHRDPKCSH